MGRLAQRYGGGTQGPWGEVDKNFEDESVGGKVPVHGVTQDVCGAEGVVKALHVPKGAGGDKGGATQGANRLITEGTERSRAQGGIASDGIIPVIRMRGQP